SWKTSRFGLGSFWFFSLLVGWLILRLILFLCFEPSTSAGEVVLAFLSGLWRDCLVGIWFTLPLFCWLVFVPEPIFRATWHRFVFWMACLIFWFGQTFLLFVEYFFFDEFRSRFNTVAVDYLQYPKEVFVNIWDSYHVGIVLFVCLVPALAWVLTARRLFAG